MYSIYSCDNPAARFPWKRLAWLVFITLYAGLFFYNCFRPNRSSFAIYLYTMLLVLWLDTEYFQRHLFFQSGMLPVEIYDRAAQLFLVRSGLALCFYSSFILGISTIVWWPRFQIGLYPFTTMAAIILLAASAFLRLRFQRNPPADPQGVVGFHHTVGMLLLSVVLGYDSYLVLILVAGIGLPLSYLQATLERKALSEFLRFAVTNDNRESPSRAEYCSRWERFIESRSSRRKK